MPVPIPGFDAYLRRTHPESTNAPLCDMSHKPVKEIGVTRGDLTVVDVKHSSNIKRLEYDHKEKTLTTVFVSGGVDIKEGISAEIFAQVAHPGPEFEHSVGKAFHALVVKPSKKLRKS
jgi:hypothetical protein